MDKFIKPVDLLSELCSIVSEAKTQLQIVCPFVQLHHHLKRAMKAQQNNDNLKITFLFGKYSINEHYKLPELDFEFLKSFPNIEILYHQRLHAKFYANDKIALVTTLNLNHTSANNNLEYGIKLEGESNPLAKEIKNFVKEIISECEIMYQKFPEKVVSINKSDSNDVISRIRTNFPKAYERWTKEDDNFLEELIRDKKTVQQLSEIFKRQPGAIMSRIIKLELHEKYGL